MKSILFLNENPLPPTFTRGTIAAKELRLRAAINDINQVHVIARRGSSMVKPGAKLNTQGPLEKKIIVHLLPPCPYYLATIGLFIWGLYYALKLKPLSIESESPHISGPAAIIISRIMNIPSLIEYRASYHEILNIRFPKIPISIKRYILDAIIWPTLKHANGVIANSNTYKAYIHQYGINSYVINPGILDFPENKSKVITRPIKIGYLGRLVPEKGIQILIEACNILQQNSQTPQFQLHIAGSGPQEQQLKKLIAKYHLEKQTTFHGFADNQKFLREIHILINPNTVSHPLEMVNAEAAYLHTPVICFADGETPETVIDQQTGIKVHKKNPQALAKAISKLINNPKLYKYLSQQSHSFATSNYSFDNQVLELKKIYTQLQII